MSFLALLWRPQASRRVQPLGFFLLCLGLTLSSLIISTLGVARAEAPLPNLSGRVTDLARLLSPGAAQALESQLSEYERETGHQFAFVSIETLDGGAIEDFSIRLAEKWKLGDKKRDDGLLLLVAKTERKMRIEVGYGLEGAIPDALSAQIIRNELRPAFQAGDFDGGIARSFTLLQRAAQGEAIQVPDSKEKRQPGARIFQLLPIILFVLFFAAMAGGGRGRRRSMFYGGGLGGLGMGGLGGRGGGFGGGGGSFGGGGGGFGGGGASGGW